MLRGRLQQSVAQADEVGDGQGFGAAAGVDVQAVEECHQVGGRTLEQGGVGGQGVFQGFAAGGEGGLDYLLEQVLIGGRQFRNSGQEAQNHGVDLGSGIKITRAQGKKPLQVKMVAQQDRQYAVVLAAGPGQQTLADFLLEHQNQHPDGGFFLQQFEEERRSNLIRQIADNRQGMTGLPAERQEIEVQDIGADNVHVGQPGQDFLLRGWGAGAGPAPGRQPDAAFWAKKKVKAPRPGPISTTVSRSSRLSAATRRRAWSGCRRKFCPNDFFGVKL